MKEKNICRPGFFARIEKEITGLPKNLSLSPSVRVNKSLDSLFIFLKVTPLSGFPMHRTVTLLDCQNTLVTNDSKHNSKAVPPARPPTTYAHLIRPKYRAKTKKGSLSHISASIAILSHFCFVTLRNESSSFGYLSFVKQFGHEVDSKSRPKTR